jgi:hypothetical protein
MVVPILTYGTEIWAIKRKQESKIETAKMKYFSSVAGCTRKDQVRNTKLRNKKTL